MRCRVLVAAAIACVFLIGSAHAAGAQDGGDQEHGHRVSVTGGLVVASGESIDGPAVSANGPVRIDGRVNGAVYVGRGDLRIDGRVTGDVLVLDGDALIRGRVGGSVTVLNGKAAVRPGADVHGDVASRTAPTAARGTVQGHVAKLDINSLFAGFVVVILVVLWVAVTLSTAILGLFFVSLFPRAADAVVVAGRRVWSSFFLGLFVGIIALVLGLAIMASVVGIPLGFAVLGTLAVLFPLGYVASALIFGRLMVHRSGTGGRVGAFFAGFGILRFGALVPGLGFVIGFFFATYGFGAVIIAAWRAGRRAFGVEELQPEYAAVPSRPYNYEEQGWPGYVPVPEPRRRAAPRATRARTAGSRKAPAKKRATSAKAGGGKRSTAKKSRTTRARKSGPRKQTAKKTTKKTTKRTKKTTTRKPAKRTGKKTTRTPAKRTAKKTTRRPTKRTAKKTTAKKPTRKTAKRSATSANGRASGAKRASSNNSRANKQSRKRKSPARKTSTNRSRSRSRARA
jgi:cytoskeletal protein CcmA (bactofilin family)